MIGLLVVLYCMCCVVLMMGSCSLLHKYFGFVWDHHVDRLCPRVPNRLDYIHWIAELLEESEEVFANLFLLFFLFFFFD